MDKKLRIAELLAKDTPWNQIAKKLKTSPKTISKVSKLMESGVIRVEDGKAFYTKKYVEAGEPGGLSPEAVELVYRLMRLLGAKSETEALKEACQLVTAMNPYVLYHGLDKPSRLIRYFQSRMAEYEREAARLQTDPEYTLRRLGLPERVFRLHQFVKDKYGYKLGVIDFLVDCVDDFFMSRGYRIGSDGRVYRVRVEERGGHVYEIQELDLA